MHSQIANHLGRRLVFCGKALRAHFEAALAIEGATVPTWAVLAHAHESPGLSQTELAEIVGIESPTLVRHLDRLSNEGLVVRRRDEVDRRVTRIELTDAGRALYERLAEVAEGLDAALRSLFTPEEEELLERMLIRITAYAEDAHVSTRR